MIRPPAFDGATSAVTDLRIWDRLSGPGCEKVALALGRALSAPWRFTQVRYCALSDQERHVAFFDWNGAEFALIPGGQVTLGYDRSRPPILTREQEQEYREHSQEVSGLPPFSDHLDALMTPLRVVTIAPFLLEVRARDFSGREVSPVGHGSATLYQHRTVRRTTFREALEESCAGGFRLPSSDEWEYACGAGCRAFWRWGQGCPPIGMNAASWELHRKPNAFGLHIAEDSYEIEWCTTPDQLRGGDGGVAVCGGDGEVVAWITLATAYADSVIADTDGKDFMNDQFIWRCRRALSLGITDGPPAT
jgi:formylglycine-generating enzyme required for sulfatase activity